MQLGSLRQLILFSFFLALLPLLVLLWQTYQSLQQLASIADGQARSAVDLTRSVEALQKRSTDLQRVVSQYQIVQNPDMRPLIARQLLLVNEALRASCTDTAFASECLQLQQVLEQLDETADKGALASYFDRLQTQVAEFDQMSRQWLDDKLDAQQQRVMLTQSRLTWQTLALIMVTLLMVWGASQLVLGPIQQIQRLIQAIAGQQSQLPEKSFNYPYELVQVDQQLRWLEARLQELEKVRHTMLRHASHELKTPLASMIEGCSLLVEGVVGPLTPAQQEVVGLLDSSVKRLHQLVQELLDYNRLLQEANARPQRLDIRALLNDIWQSHELAASQQQMRLATEVALEKVWADEHLLRRILDNLLNNAIAYGKTGSQIRIQVRGEQGMQYVSIDNDYVGRLAQTQQLFEPFHRGELERHDGVSGSGLGLSIVADCARMMAGDVAILSAANNKFCLRVALPAQGNEGDACASS